MNKYRLHAGLYKKGARNLLLPANYVADEWVCIPPPDRNGVITELFESCAHCRETLAGFIVARLAYKDQAKQRVFNKFTKGRNGKIYFLCLMLLDCDINSAKHAVEKAKFNKRFKRAMQFINYYEKTFTKWPITTSHVLASLPYDENDEDDEYGFDEEDSGGTVEVRLVSCSKNWIYSPHLFSLFILMFRTGFYLTHRSIVAHTEAKIEKIQIQRFSSWQPNDESCSVHDNLDWIKEQNSGKKWGKFLSNIKKLYGGLTFKDNWTGKNYGQYIFNVSHDGINALLTGESNNSAVAAKAQTLGLAD